ncbi:MAG: hypothetical protein QW039_00945 [Fervidicoccaceae archaeon]
MALVQAILAFLFFFFLALVLMDSDNPKMKKKMVFLTIAVGAIFAASFYVYIESFGTKLSIYPLFILESKGGYSTMLIDLSQIVLIMMMYKALTYLRSVRFHKK